MAIPQAELRRMAIVKHVIFALVAIAVVVPFVAKVYQRSFQPTVYSRALFEKVDSLAPNTPVLLSFDYDPGSEAELLPMSVAILRHCFQKRLIPLVMTNYPSGVDLARSILEDSIALSEKDCGRKLTSGTDYAFLGFRPGGVNLLYNMGENLKAAFQTDFYGKPTAAMPALATVRSLKDLKLVIDISSSAWVETWIVYGADRFGFEYGAGVTAVMGPDMYPFLQSGQIVGLLDGLRGAADYELLLQRTPRAEKRNMIGRGVLGMTAQSAAHVLIIVLVLAANARFVFRRVTGREKG